MPPRKSPLRIVPTSLTSAVTSNLVSNIIICVFGQSRCCVLPSTAPRNTQMRAVRRALATFAGPRQRSIEERLTSVFSPTHLEVLNESHGKKEDESHFKVVVVSEAFAAKRLIARHRAVNDALLDERGTLPFHSLSIGAAKTPDEWAKANEVPASPKCAGGDGRGLKL